MDVNALTTDALTGWAIRQLRLADEILSDPGGGLLFATQTIGQVRAALQESAGPWAGAADILLGAEDAGVRREFEISRDLIREAIAKLS